MTLNDCFICKAEEWGVAVAASIDDNAADEKTGRPGVSYLLFGVLGRVVPDSEYLEHFIHLSSWSMMGCSP